MLVHIRRQVCSSVPGHTGRWTLVTERDLPAAPRDGDLIELAPGWCSMRVKYTTYTAAGEVHADLRTVLTESMEDLREWQALADDHGWQWTGGDGPFSTARPG